MGTKRNNTVYDLVHEAPKKTCGVYDNDVLLLPVAVI